MTINKLITLLKSAKTELASCIMWFINFAMIMSLLTYCHDIVLSVLVHRPIILFSNAQKIPDNAQEVHLKFPIYCPLCSS